MAKPNFRFSHFQELSENSAYPFTLKQSLCTHMLYMRMSCTALLFVWLTSYRSLNLKFPAEKGIAHLAGVPVVFFNLDFFWVIFINKCEFRHLICIKC